LNFAWADLSCWYDEVRWSSSFSIRQLISPKSWLPPQSTCLVELLFDLLQLHRVKVGELDLLFSHGGDQNTREDGE
jgi:hypothetical protein